MYGLVPLEEISKSGPHVNVDVCLIKNVSYQTFSLIVGIPISKRVFLETKTFSFFFLNTKCMFQNSVPFWRNFGPK